MSATNAEKPSGPASVDGEEATELHSEDLAQIDQEAAKRDAADKSYPPGRSKRPSENVTASSSKRSRHDQDASRITRMRTTLRPHLNKPYSVCDENGKERRSKVVAEIAEFWKNDYKTWPIVLASGNRSSEISAPRDWGYELLKKVLLLAQQAHQLGTDVASLQSRLEQASKDRKQRTNASSDCVLPVDVQEVINRLSSNSRLQDESTFDGRSPTIARTEIGRDGDSENVSNRPLGEVMMHNADAGDLGEETVQPLEEELYSTTPQPTRPMAQAITSVADRGTLQTVPLTDLIPYMDAREIEQLATRLFSLAEARKRYEGEIASLVRD
ncbi:Hypothetical predicted protein [Lecanosticta acicola]|uniref:Uncharacterized protein n=1 Tax=Lecanosticta acicola TaxID=111012 RepID=A0AAI8Z1H4_9PEZI|nr:Hypothetical predicted protein [Lecanosticta acicola]